MRYLPHTQEDIQEMLEAVGAASLEDLFSTIPKDCKRKNELDLADPMPEWELKKQLSSMAEQNLSSGKAQSFLGAGSYEHYIPASVQYLISRSEFCTAYTPYQPEISQGTLQAIFEYQTLVSRLLGMEVSNASMYDGASALAEALFMALRVSRKKKTVAISKLIHPFYRELVKTYFQPTGFNVLELPYNSDGRTDLSQLENHEDLAAVAVQSPNFFGCLEDQEEIASKVHNKGALFVSCFTEPLTYGLFKSPGKQGADIACGEGQSLGLSQSFGGPGLGIFCSLKKFVRNMPGRLIGATQDKNGKPGYVLTLATREQHIRREKATSNICSNQGLCATQVAMYLASLGGTGLRKLALTNHSKAKYLLDSFKQSGFEPEFDSPFFNEFVLKLPKDKFDRLEKLEEKNIFPGLRLDNYYPELERHILVCATECKTKEDLDNLVKEVENV